MNNKDLKLEQQPNSEQMPIDSTEAIACTKPNVGCRYLSNKVVVEMPKVVGKVELPVDSSTRPKKRTRKNFFLPTDKCCYCDRIFNENLKATKEHIVPKSKGGTNKLNNLKPCCVECNSLRSNFSLKEFKMMARLIRRIMKKTLTYTTEDLERIFSNLGSV